MPSTSSVQHSPLNNEGTEMTSNETGNPIEAVRERLGDGRKWIKGQMFGPGGTACLVGAAADVMPSMASRMRSFYPLVEAVIDEQYSDRLDGISALIPSFNDHPQTTWADVDLVLNKASIAWDETVR